MRRKRVMQKKFSEEIKIGEQMLKSYETIESVTYIWESKEGRKVLAYSSKEGRRGAKWRLLTCLSEFKLLTFKSKIEAAQFMLKSRFQDTKNLELINLDFDLNNKDIRSLEVHKREEM